MKLISETRVWFALLEVLASAGATALASTMNEERGVECMLAGNEGRQLDQDLSRLARHIIYIAGHIYFLILQVAGRVMLCIPATLLKSLRGLPNRSLSSVEASYGVHLVEVRDELGETTEFRCTYLKDNQC